ncbi:hypothetical protein [Nicoletella semolina]|nr:hypothetical protein [Nicoletella semolina]
MVATIRNAAEFLIAAKENGEALNAINVPAPSWIKRRLFNVFLLLIQR